MKFTIFIITFVFTFVGCSTSSLIMGKNNTLVLKYNSNALLLSKNNLNVKSLNYKDMFVDIYKLKSGKGKILFYEDARTESNFEFNFSELYTIMYIFGNLKEYEDVYIRNNLSFFQLRLKNDSYLNIMIQASDTQEYSYIYGFSNKDFLEIINTIRGKNKEPLKLKHKALTLSENSKELSKWNDKLVYFTPLITPIRVMGRF